MELKDATENGKYVQNSPHVNPGLTVTELTVTLALPMYIYVGLLSKRFFEKKILKVFSWEPRI